MIKQSDMERICSPVFLFHSDVGIELGNFVNDDQNTQSLRNFTNFSTGQLKVLALLQFVCKSASILKYLMRNCRNNVS